MADEVTNRLKDCSEACVKAWEAWNKDRKNANAREDLQDAVHELRKVASRLEIELATSDQKASQKPMPIPSHRDKGRVQSPDNNGNSNNGDGGDDKPVKKHKLPPRKTLEEKKEAKES